MADSPGIRGFFPVGRPDEDYLRQRLALADQVMPRLSLVIDTQDGSGMTYQQHLKALSKEYEAEFGFGLPWHIPDYRPSRRGEWTLSCRPGMAGQSYLAGHVVDHPHHLLSKGGEAWMTTSMLEIESHAWHLECCSGQVLIAGLGMGMLLHAVASKPEVRAVVVLELDGDVIELFKETTGFDSWEQRDKITILEADALDPAACASVEAALCGVRPDYLYADIWSEFPAHEAPGQTKSMCDLYRPRAAGWWGQEIEYGLRHDGGPTGVTVDDMSAFFSGCGVPVFPTEGYVAFTQAAMEAQLAYEPPRRVSAPAPWTKVFTA